MPTLEEFAPKFLDGYAKANRQKPSGIAAKETIGRIHLIPRLGSKRLDKITTEDVQHLKRHLDDRSPKTVNNVVVVLSVLLKKAVEWDVIDRVPCVIRLLPIPKPSAGFYDFDEYARLIEAAKLLDRRTHLIVLLGGDAGLRCGEMMALEWQDVDLHKRQLCVQRQTGEPRHPVDTIQSVPSPLQANRSLGTFDASAIARKVSARQLTTAATSSVSGDHWSPGHRTRPVGP